MNKLIFLIFLFFPLKIFSQENNQSVPDSLIESYNYSLETHDCISGLKYIEMILKYRPTDDNFYWRKALLFQKNKCRNIDSIFFYYQKAIDLNDSISDYYFSRASFLWREGGKDNFSKAVRDLEIVIKLDSFYYPAWEKIQTHNYWENPKYAVKLRKTALRKMEEGIKKDSLNSMRWVWLGQSRHDAILYSGSKMTMKDVVSCYDKAILIDSFNTSAYWHRAIENYEQKKYENCISDMRNAMRYHFTSVHFSYVILSYERLGNIEKALEITENALQEFPDDSQLLNIKKDLLKKKK